MYIRITDFGQGTSTLHVHVRHCMVNDLYSYVLLQCTLYIVRAQDCICVYIHVYEYAYRVTQHMHTHYIIQCTHTVPECFEHDGVVDDSAVHLVTDGSQVQVQRGRVLVMDWGRGTRGRITYIYMYMYMNTDTRWPHAYIHVHVFF